MRTLGWQSFSRKIPLKYNTAFNEKADTERAAAEISASNDAGACSFLSEIAGKLIGSVILLMLLHFVVTRFYVSL